MSDDGDPYRRWRGGTGRRRTVQRLRRGEGTRRRSPWPPPPPPREFENYGRVGVLRPYRKGKSALEVPQLVIGIMKRLWTIKLDMWGPLNCIKPVIRDLSVVLTPILVYMTAEPAWDPHEPHMSACHVNSLSPFFFLFFFLTYSQQPSSE